MKLSREEAYARFDCWFGDRRGLVLAMGIPEHAIDDVLQNARTNFAKFGGQIEIRDEDKVGSVAYTVLRNAANDWRDSKEAREAKYARVQADQPAEKAVGTWEHEEDARTVFTKLLADMPPRLAAMGKLVTELGGETEGKKRAAAHLANGAPEGSEKYEDAKSKVHNDWYEFYQAAKAWASAHPEQRLCVLALLASGLKCLGEPSTARAGNGDWPEESNRELPTVIAGQREAVKQLYLSAREEIRQLEQELTKALGTTTLKEAQLKKLEEKHTKIMVDLHSRKANPAVIERAKSQLFEIGMQCMDASNEKPEEVRKLVVASRMRYAEQADAMGRPDVAEKFRRAAADTGLFCWPHPERY